MASNNRKSIAPEDTVAMTAPVPEPAVATAAQEALAQLAQVVNLRVPLTGPERDEISRLFNVVAASLGMSPTA